MERLRSDPMRLLTLPLRLHLVTGSSGSACTSRCAGSSHAMRWTRSEHSYITGDGGVVYVDTRRSHVQRLGGNGGEQDFAERPGCFTWSCQDCTTTTPSTWTNSVFAFNTLSATVVRGLDAQLRYSLCTALPRLQPSLAVAVTSSGLGRA